MAVKKNEDIQRALGILQGLSYCAEQAISEGIVDALEMLEAALKEDN